MVVTINNILTSLPQISGKLSFLFKYSNQRVHVRCEENLLCHTTTPSPPRDVSKICAIYHSPGCMRDVRKILCQSKTCVAGLVREICCAIPQPPRLPNLPLNPLPPPQGSLICRPPTLTELRCTPVHPAASPSTVLLSNAMKCN